MRRNTIALALATLAMAAPATGAMAAGPAPEITRPAAPAQSVGVAHTLRSIPEACARLEGLFTGDPAQPYKVSAVRTSPNCQPRAHLVDAAKVKPDAASGWKFNDVIRVPSAACLSQQAVVRVWRKPAGSAPPALDGQGRSRIYLDESRQTLEQGKLARLTLFAAAMSLEGKPCGQ